MLSPRMGGGGGGGYPRGFDCEVCPKGGDFDRTTYPQGGEFDMATILNNKEGLEINLFPPQVVRERPWKRGCLKITPPS